MSLIFSRRTFYPLSDGRALSWVFYEFLTTTRGRRYHHLVRRGIVSEPYGRAERAPRERNFLLIISKTTKKVDISLLIGVKKWTATTYWN